MPPVGMALIRVKVSPKISSQSAGWIARVYSSVRSCRSFCSSTMHIALTRVSTTLHPARARGGVNNSSRPRDEASADAGGGTAGAPDITEPLCLVVGFVEATADEVPEDVLQGWWRCLCVVEIGRAACRERGW